MAFAVQWSQLSMLKYFIGRRHAFVVVLCIFFVSFGTGCAKKIVSQVYNEGATKLDKEACVYVVKPKDGSYGNILYSGSGAITSSYICVAFASIGVQCMQSSTMSTFEASVRDAYLMNCKYVVVPDILHWEDRNTPWSGKLDRVTVKIDVYNVDSKRVISSSLIEANNQWATFVDNPPEVLLPEPFKQLVNTLY